MPCWDKECETLYRSFTQAPVGTDSDRAISSLLSRLGQKKQKWWEEAVNSIDFSHASRKAWRTINKLTGRSDTPSTSAPSRQTPSPRNLWRTGHTRPGIVSPPGWPTRSCPTYGKFQHLRVTVFLNHIGQRNLLLPQTPEARNVSGIGLHLPGVHSLLHAGSALKSWISHFLSSCMRQLKIPKTTSLTSSKKTKTATTRNSGWKTYICKGRGVSNCRLGQCFSNGFPRNLKVPQVTARGSAERDRDRICLGPNLQRQFYAVVAI